MSVGTFSNTHAAFYTIIFKFLYYVPNFGWWRESTERSYWRTGVAHQPITAQLLEWGGTWNEEWREYSHGIREKGGHCTNWGTVGRRGLRSPIIVLGRTAVGRLRRDWRGEFQIGLLRQPGRERDRECVAFLDQRK